MSPGRGRSQDKYDPWKLAEPEPEPEARNPGQARTWTEWEALCPRVDSTNWSAPVPALPYRLDWQRNPAAKPPPGYVMARCLDGVTLLRPADWRGRAYRHGRFQETKPTTTIGDRCEQCHAPYLRVEHRDDPYIPPEGFQLTRCLCHLELHRVAFGTWSPPTEPCERCGAPPQDIADSDAGYAIGVDLPEQPGWREFWRKLERESWAVGDVE